MNIWIISVGEPLPTDGSNVRLRRMGNLAKYLSEEGHIVNWFSVSFDHYKKCQRCNKNKSTIINDNYTMHLIFTPGYKKNISFARIFHHKIAGRNIYKKMEQIPKPDIILASMEPLEVSAVAAKFGAKYKIPVVIDVRDLWPEIYFEVVPRCLHIFLKIYVNICRYTLKKTMRNAYSIIGLSKNFLEYGLQYSGRDQGELDKVFPIAYPNYDYSQWSDKFDEYWGKLGIKKNDFLVVFLGNFGKQFSFKFIIDAANELIKISEIKFVLCGTGQQMDDIKLHAPKNVFFTGWIEEEQILSLAANAKIGLAPYIDSKNYIQNTPNKFGEYLSASLPIAVSVKGIMEELLNQYKCGFRYNSGIELAAIIKHYYEDGNLWEEHSYNARCLYEEQFNADNSNKQLSNYLKKVTDYYERV
jgi:glycosyltransferase involved in cell wall biosynthesis